MGDIILPTTTLQANDSTNNLLAKILTRLNLNASGQVDLPSSNVAVTNTPLPVDFNGTQPVSVQGQANVLVDNFPAIQPISGTIDVGNFPSSQDVVVTNTPTVDAGIGFTGDGHVSTLAVPFEFEVSHSGSYLESGANKAALTMRVLGRRAGFNSNTVLQDIGEWLGATIDLLPEPTGAESFELVSSSAQDDNTPGGTGTRTVRIAYLNTSYVLTTVDYALNGLTPVPVAEQMLFIYYMEALTGGSSEVTIGNVDLRIAGGGAIHERITAGGNRSMTSRFMVPDNYNAFIGEWMLTSIGGATMDCRLRAKVRTLGRALNDRYIFHDTAFISAGSVSTKALGYVKYPPRSKIKISVLPSGIAASNRIDSTFNVLLVQE